MSDDPLPQADNEVVAKGDRQKRLLEQVRKEWGKPLERERNFGLIRLFHRWSKATASVDDSTWGDLAMDEVFAAIDRTRSVTGQQVLYHQLRTGLAGPVLLAERARQQDILRDDASLRERLQLLLEQLNRPGAEYVAPLLLGGMPDKPRLAWLYRSLAVASMGCLVATGFFHWMVVPVLVLLLVNVAISATYGQRILPHFTGFASINTLLGVAAEVAKLPDRHALPQLGALRQSAPLIAGLRKRLGWLVADRSAMPEMTQWLFGYLNMMFLFDVLIFLRSLKILREKQSQLVGIFEALGSLDASIAVASYVSGLPVFCRPELVETRRLEVTGIYHPLIPNAVDNPLSLTDRGALIAGPNMAGKTAFIRTIGINLILAQTLDLCLARRAILPRAVVRSAIRREDKLSEGSSYFYSEIKQVQEFTQLGAGGLLHVILIDEIFRGTNTIERIASSAAVLRHLARTQIVLATTHDSELQALLGDVFAMYHFSDQVVNGTYGFDYHICTGPVRSRNAIKLLALSGYAKEITDEAERLAAQLEPRPG